MFKWRVSKCWEIYVQNLELLFLLNSSRDLYPLPLTFQLPWLSQLWSMGLQASRLLYTGASADLCSGAVWMPDNTYTQNRKLTPLPSTDSSSVSFGFGCFPMLSNRWSLYFVSRVAFYEKLGLIETTQLLLREKITLTFYKLHSYIYLASQIVTLYGNPDFHTSEVFHLHLHSRKL